MNNTIRVTLGRRVIPDSDILGTVGELCASELAFVLPPELEGYRKTLIFENSLGSFPYENVGGVFAVPSEVTSETSLSLQIVLTEADGTVIFKSEPCRFSLFPSLDDSGKNAITQAKAEQAEADRVKLAQALTEQDIFNGKQPDDWQRVDAEALLFTVSTTAVMTEADNRDLMYLQSVRRAAEGTELNDPLKSIDVWKQIEAAARGVTSVRDAPLIGSSTGRGEAVRVPYLYTPGITTATTVYQNTAECGFDLSGVTGPLGSVGSAQSYLFYPCRDNLEKVKLTGIRNGANAEGIFQGCTKLKSAELYGENNVVKPANFYNIFYECRSLKEVSGNPFDFTGIKEAVRGFLNCEMLEEIRFAPNTIAVSLQLQQSTKLSKATVLSLINGIAADSGVTLSLHSFVKSNMASNWTAVWDEASQTWQDGYGGTQRLSFTEILTTPVSPEYPHCKGVTLA